MRLAVAILACLVAAGCLKRSVPAESAVPAVTVTDSVTRAATSQPTPPMAIPAQGVLIKRGEVTLIVPDAEVAENKIKDLMKLHGAYVSARESHAVVPQGAVLGPSEVRSLTLTIRVEARAFDAFMAGLKQAGSYTDESVRVEDVTFAYVDLNARLANQRRVEERLLKYLDDPARDYKMVIEVERELARVREQIEQLSAQLRVMENQIAYSTVIVHLSVRSDWVPPEERTFGQQLGDAIGDSLEALGGTARLAVIAAVAALPWMATIAVVVLSVLAIVRRSSRRRKARTP